MAAPADFLIVGGGAVGMTSAIALLQAGYRVTLLERGQTGREASWAGGGIMSPLCSWDYRDSVTQLSQRSMGMFPATMTALQDATGVDPEYQRSGMLVLPPYPHEQAVAWCQRHQVAHQPASLPGTDRAGLLLPDVAQVRNPRLLRALRMRVQQLGGVILEQHEVLRWQVQGDAVVALETSQGRHQAENYILAAGSWSEALLPPALSLKLHIQPVRGQILLLKFDAPPLPHIVVQQRLYLIPRRDGHVLIGSTLEEAGFDKTTTEEARAELWQQTLQLFPHWQGQPIVQHWAGLRPGTPDNIPTIGRHPQLRNLYANTGHFRYGVTMSLASAELLLNEIEQRPQPLDVSAYRWPV